MAFKRAAGRFRLAPPYPLEKIENSLGLVLDKSQEFDPTTLQSHLGVSNGKDAKS